MKGKEIHLHFHPKGFEQGQHVIEKADSQGRKRRYLAGISSGIRIDEHGERMTEKCIKSFMDQSNSGQVLLYPDKHGIKASEDIGFLSKAQILDSNDWYTEYGLWDKGDGIGAYKAEQIDTIWKQVNGLPPYQKARQKGFSIEGIIPEAAIQMDNFGNVDRKVIDDIALDGVVLVPRPAYKDSVATAIYKALGETTPYRIESIQGAIRNKIAAQEVQDSYYKLKWDYQDALEMVLEKIMVKANNNKEEELEVLFDEYKKLMIDLIMSSEKMFAAKQDPSEIIDIAGISEDQPQLASAVEGEENNPKLDLFKSLYVEMNQLNNLLEERHNGQARKEN